MHEAIPTGYTVFNVLNGADAANRCMGRLRPRNLVRLRRYFEWPAIGASSSLIVSSARCPDTVRDGFCNSVEDLLPKLRLGGTARHDHATDHGRKCEDCLLPSPYLRFPWSNSTEKLDSLPLSDGHCFLDGRGLARELTTERPHQTARFRPVVMAQ